MEKRLQDSFQAKVIAAAQQLIAHAPRRALVVHHNDTDGLSAGSILIQSLKVLGAEVQNVCLEKTYHQAMTSIQSFVRDSNIDSLLITDFSSGIIESFRSTLEFNGYFAVLDHHALEQGAKDFPTLLNPMGFDESAGKDLSASMICAAFAFALDHRNSTFCWALGALGAFGDGHFRMGNFSGMNEFFLSTLPNCTSFFRDSSDGPEVLLEQWHLASELKRTLDMLGSFGYLKGGPRKALSFLAGELAFTELQEEANEYFRLLKQESARIFQQSIHFGRAGLQYFFLDEAFDEAGVKTVGLVCELLCSWKNVDEDRYVVGFQRVPKRIPELDAELSGVKVSLRVPPRLWAKIQRGEAKNLIELVRTGASAVGASIDGAHPHAAAIVIQEGREEQFLTALERAVA